MRICTTGAIVLGAKYATFNDIIFLSVSTTITEVEADGN